MGVPRQCGQLPSGRESPADADPPLAVTATVQSARRLVGVCPRAAALGLGAGLMLTEARALVPELVAVPADPGADAAALAEFAQWCRRYSPAVAVDGADGVLIDIAGAAHLFGGEETVMDDLVLRLARVGLTARVAVADTAGAARALARAFPRCLSQPGAAAGDLAALPVACLDLDTETLNRLGVLGLRRIGDLARLETTRLAPRLGAVAMATLARALGRAGEPFRRLAEPVPFRVFRRLAEPITEMADIERVLADLAPVLERDLEARGQGARRLCLTLYRVDGRTRGLEVAAAAPLRDSARMSRLLRDRLARLEGGLAPGFGFDLVALEALAVEDLAPRQGDALEAGRGARDAAPLVDRLTGRLGVRAVRRLVPAQSHIPERAVVLEPVVAASEAEGGGWAGEPWAPADGLPPARPLQLLPAPEPIAVVAEVPDGPPLRFTWRRRLYRVARADGPERIAAEWWRAAAPTRDYYRLEDEAGARFWVYRAGLFGRETAAPRWYLHGLFA